MDFLLLTTPAIGGAVIALALFLVLPEFRDDRDRIKRAVGLSGSDRSS